MISLHEKSEKWMYTFYLADVLLSISILEKNKFLQRVKTAHDFWETNAGFLNFTESNE